MKNAVPRLRLLRAERLQSQAVVAKAIGVSAGRYSQLENGYGALATDKEIAALAKHFGVTESRLGLKARSKSGRAAA
jgi:transcriptional regulator with XRE-family HTH domain